MSRLNGKTVEAMTAPAERAAAATNRLNETLTRTETETRSAASGASGLAATLIETAEVATTQIGRVERLMGELRTRAAGYGGGVVGAGRGFSEAVQSGIGSGVRRAGAGAHGGGI